MEVLSFMKLEQIIFVKEVVSFLKKLLVSRKQDNVSPKLKTSIVGNVIKLRNDEPSRYYCLDGIFIWKHDENCSIATTFKKIYNISC